MHVALLFLVLASNPPTINVPGRLTVDTIGVYEKGRAVWVDAFRQAEVLLKKLEKIINGDMEDHERQCFLQEAVKHLIPQVKDGVKITGAPQGDVTPEKTEYVLKRVDQVNRCSPTNRGYVAFHAWREAGFQEPRQLPEGQKMTMSEFVRGIAALGVGVGRTAPVSAPAGIPLPILSPDLVPAAMPRKEPKPGEMY